MKLLVIDASVALKWFLKDEPQQEQALAILDDFLLKRIDVQVPQIWLPEICNILPRRIVDDGYLESILSQLMLFKIQQVDLNISIINLAFDLMREFAQISFYDASYHALALQTGGLLLTADKKYYDKVRKKGNIQYLADYGK